jgi:hypothetical protein
LPTLNVDPAATVVILVGDGALEERSIFRWTVAAPVERSTWRSTAPSRRTE